MVPWNHELDLNVGERVGISVVTGIDLWHWYDLSTYAIVTEEKSGITSKYLKAE